MKSKYITTNKPFSLQWSNQKFKSVKRKKKKPYIPQEWVIEYTTCLHLVETTSPCRRIHCSAAAAAGDQSEIRGHQLFLLWSESLRNCGSNSPQSSHNLSSLFLFLFFIFFFYFYLFFILCLDRTYFAETENLLLKSLQQNNF